MGQVLRDELELARREREGYKRYSNRLYPRASGYDRLKNVIDGWNAGLWELEAALEKLSEIVKSTDAAVSKLMAEIAKPVEE